MNGLSGKIRKFVKYIPQGLKPQRFWGPPMYGLQPVPFNYGRYPSIMPVPFNRARPLRPSLCPFDLGHYPRGAYAARIGAISLSRALRMARLTGISCSSNSAAWISGLPWNQRCTTLPRSRLVTASSDMPKW